MILVITYTAPRTEYDNSGRVVEEKGEVYVSHGINFATGKTIILPQEKWRNFKHNCISLNGEWFLK